MLGRRHRGETRWSSWSASRGIALVIRRLLEFARPVVCRIDGATVWQVALKHLLPLRLALTEVLSPDERARANGTDGIKEFVSISCSVRGVLRIILGEAGNMNPATIAFTHATHGKPSLSTPSCRIQFSASHSAGLALVAVTRGRRVGIDVEARREVPEAEHIAARFFSEQERRRLASLGDYERAGAFFDIWARKEAFVKGLGLGLRFPLSGIDVWEGTREPTRPRFSDTTGPNPAWVITHVPVETGWAAGVWRMKMPIAGCRQHPLHWTASSITAFAVAAAPGLGPIDGRPHGRTDAGLLPGHGGLRSGPYWARWRPVRPGSPREERRPTRVWRTTKPHSGAHRKTRLPGSPPEEAAYYQGMADYEALLTQGYLGLTFGHAGRLLCDARRPFLAVGAARHLPGRTLHEPSRRD